MRSIYSIIRSSVREIWRTMRAFWVGDTHYRIFRGIFTETAYVLALTGVALLVVLVARALAGR